MCFWIFFHKFSNSCPCHVGWRCSTEPPLYLFEWPGASTLWSPQGHWDPFIWRGALAGFNAAHVNAFYPFHVVFAYFGDASSAKRFASAVLPFGFPWASRCFCGSLRRPSQAGRFHVENAVLRPLTTPTLKPRDGFVRPARRRRENQSSESDFPLRFEGRLTLLSTR
jgi:hypothetical protein